jgi:hypothetical protein
MRGVLNFFCLLLLFLPPAGAAGAGGTVTVTRTVSLCASSQGAAVRSCQLRIQGMFLPLGKVIHVRVGGQEAAVLNAIQLSRGQLVPVSSAMLQTARGEVEFTGPAAEPGSQPWEIRTIELTSVYGLPLAGPVTSKCGGKSTGSLVFRFQSEEGKNVLQFHLTENVSAESIRISLNGNPLAEIRPGPAPSSGEERPAQSIEIPSWMLKGGRDNLLVFKAVGKDRSLEIRDVVIDNAIPLPSPRARGWAPEIGLGGNRRSVTYSVPGQSGDMVLSFSVYDADSPDEIEVKVNGKRLRVLGEGTSDDDWSGPVEIHVPADLLQGTGRNVVTFSNLYNETGKRYHWGIREVALTAPPVVEEQKPAPPAGESPHVLDVASPVELAGPPLPATLSIESVPAGATVFASDLPGFEGEKLGETPAALELDKAGWLYLTIEKEHFISARMRLFVSEGSQTTLKTGLLPFHGLEFEAGRMIMRPAIHLPVDAEYLRPFPVDFNGDGKIDILCGTKDGAVLYIENVSGDSFGMQFADARPIPAGDAEVKVGSYASPVAVDWDDDGRGDLLVGDDSGKVYWFRGVAGGFYDNFAPPVLLEAGGRPVDVGRSAAPFVADFNRDGQKDLLVGTGFGTVYLFLNSSSEGRPQLMDGVELHLDLPPLPYGMNVVPVDFSDWTGDGRPDLVVVTMVGNYYLFENVSATAAPVFKSAELLGSLSNDGFVGVSPAPAFFDFDGDGEMDLLVGNAAGELWFLQGAG